MNNTDEIPVSQDQITLSVQDYDLFVALMIDDKEPTELSRQEAAEFKNGTIDGTRYRW